GALRAIVFRRAPLGRAVFGSETALEAGRAPRCTTRRGCSRMERSEVLVPGPARGFATVRPPAEASRAGRSSEDPTMAIHRPLGGVRVSRPQVGGRGPGAWGARGAASLGRPP